MVNHYTLSQIRETVSIDRENDKRIYTIFGALGDPSRFLIFKMLIEHQGMLCGSDVARVLDVSIYAASQQLKNLETSGLVERRRSGRKICYTVKKPDQLITSLFRVIGV